MADFDYLYIHRIVEHLINDSVIANSYPIGPLTT
jgi:hypothetical protein